MPSSCRWASIACSDDPPQHLAGIASLRGSYRREKVIVVSLKNFFAGLSRHLGGLHRSGASIEPRPGASNDRNCRM
jgi:hypothetical protein